MPHDRVSEFTRPPGPGLPKPPGGCPTDAAADAKSLVFAGCFFLLVAAVVPLMAAAAGLAYRAFHWAAGVGR